MTKKNRKARRLREVYPDVRIKLFYQRDYLNLLVKYGLEEPSQAMPDHESVEPMPLRFDVDDDDDDEGRGPNGATATQPSRTARSARRRRKPA